MSENDKNDKNVNEDSTIDKKPSKPVHKTQSEILQEALGLKPEDIQKVEKKLFIVRFLDYFSEEALDFIYKNKNQKIKNSEYHSPAKHLFQKIRS